MSAAGKINSILAKGFEVAGRAEQVANIFGTSIFNNGRSKRFMGTSEYVYQEMQQHGILKTNYGNIQIALPTNHIFRKRYNLPFNMEFVDYRADSFPLPGLGLATSEIKRYGYGPNEKKPYAPVYTDVNFTFIGDKEGKIHKFFYLWMNSMVNHHKPGSINSTDEKADYAFPYEVEYKDSYKADINIFVYSEDGTVTEVVKLQDAYPIFMGDIQYSWGDQDQLVRVPVTFTYYSWQIENVADQFEQNRSVAKNNNSLGTIGKIVKTATAIQTLASLKKPQNIGDVINVVSNTKSVVSNLPF